MNRVLLTGGSGFIGTHVVPALVESGFETHVVSRRAPKRPFAMAGVTSHRCDLESPEQVWRLTHEIRPTHLLHLAWYTEHGQFWKSPKNLDCVAASLNLLRAFADCGGRRVVIAGTCAEYDWSVGDGTFAESAPTNPHTLYGQAKNALRQLVRHWTRDISLSWGWGRIFLLYGPQEDERRLVPSISIPLIEGRVAHCLSGSHIRDFLHVRDVAEAFVALLSSDVQGTVNIGSGEGVPLERIARRIAAAARAENRLGIDHRVPTPENPERIVADVRRLTQEVGWTPKWSLDAGLDSVVQETMNHLATQRRKAA